MSWGGCGLWTGSAKPRAGPRNFDQSALLAEPPQRLNLGKKVPSFVPSNPDIPGHYYGWCTARKVRHGATFRCSTNTQKPLHLSTVQGVRANRVLSSRPARLMPGLVLAVTLADQSPAVYQIRSLLIFVFRAWFWGRCSHHRETCTGRC